MKKMIIASCFLFATASINAQVVEKIEEIIVDTVPSAKRAKSQKNKTITLCLKGDNAKQEKVVIEIDGKKIKMNGKDIADLKDIDVTINENEIHFNNNGTVLKMYPGQNFSWGEGESARAMKDRYQDMKGRVEEMRGRVAKRAFLGIGMEKVEEGVKITSVTEGSAAAKAGLQKDDIITKLNGDAVKKEMDITTVVSTQKPGKEINVEYIRDGKKQTTKAVLGERANEVFGLSGLDNLSAKEFPFGSQNFNFDMPGQVWEREGGNQGFYFSNDAPKIGMKLKETENEKGLEVTEVEENGVAAKAGLQKGDIITKVGDVAVKNVGEIRGLMRTVREKPVQITYLRNGKEQTAEIKIAKKLKEVSL